MRLDIICQQLLSLIGRNQSTGISYKSHQRKEFELSKYFALLKCPVVEIMVINLELLLVSVSCSSCFNAVQLTFV